MINFKSSQFERDIILWRRSLVCGLSHLLSTVRGEDGRAGGGRRSLHAESVGESSMRRNLRSSSVITRVPWAGAGGWMRVCHERIARVLECDAT